MGQAVVHFEVVGKDGDKLQSYYADLFGWNINSRQPDELRHGGREGQQDRRTATGGIGGGVGQGPEVRAATSPSSSPCRTSRQALQKAESLGGKRVMGPEDNHGHGRPRAVHRPGGQPRRGRERSVAGGLAAGRVALRRAGLPPPEEAGAVPAGRAEAAERPGRLDARRGARAAAAPPRPPGPAGSSSCIAPGRGRAGRTSSGSARCGTSARRSPPAGSGRSGRASGRRRS